MKIDGIIPARYASTRFPGKVLEDIEGKSMIRRVYEQALKASLLNNVVIATDDHRIAEHVKNFNGKIVMTDPGLSSGTDRCSQAIKSMNNDIDAVINIQGDEPFISPDQIDQVAGMFEKNSTDIATLVLKVKEKEDITDRDKVKVVFDKNDNAMMFSRNPIPYDKTGEHQFYKHIGIYGYLKEVLNRITELPPSALEKAESLEQLRWLENGFNIKVELTDKGLSGIDTKEELEGVRRWCRSKKNG
ncbi:MAG: 3-deoxy-manno-octulosonate cytidylyltransferase [Flavobacteriales bacterium]